jgi:hypothetical protein
MVAKTEAASYDVSADCSARSEPSFSFLTYSHFCVICQVNINIHGVNEPGNMIRLNAITRVQT